MTDHTRTEKIGGDFIYFCGHPSRAGNRYDTYLDDFKILGGAMPFHHKGWLRHYFWLLLKRKQRISILKKKRKVLLMLILVEVVRRVGWEDGTTLGWWISFQIEICKTETTVCDMVRLALMLKLVRVLRQETWVFNWTEFLLVKRVNLPWSRKCLVFIELDWMNSYAINGYY